MIKIKIAFFSSLFLGVFSLTAQNNERIRGHVFDKVSSKSIFYATVSLLQTTEPIGTLTDSLGNFLIKGLQVGRYTLRVTCIGYETVLLKEINVSSGKETFLEIGLKEKAWEVKEVVVKAKIDKERPLNEMAAASARMFSVEEANRYAGGFDDPARLVSSFAGVAGSISTNGITVRGNSPQFLQWKLEGIEIPNPTHFPDLTGVGGGIITALSSQVLGNSDFLTGAFPAEYGNALSGVFDMKLRIGNNQKPENTIQIGTMGIDLASEGPFQKGKPASYLFNYRYSSMGLIDKLVPGGLGEAGGLRYQDLSFKINIPTLKKGVFSVWGIGTLDKYLPQIIEDSTEWNTRDDRIKNQAKQRMGVFGLAHRYFFIKDAYLQTNLVLTYRSNNLFSQLILPGKQFQDDFDIKEHTSDLILNSYLNKKFSARHTNKTGITITELFYGLDYQMRYPYQTEMQAFAKGKGHSLLMEIFSSSIIEITPCFTAYMGINARYFALNNRSTLEPRFGIKWKMNEKQSFSFAYGMHSRHEKPDYYFIQSETGEYFNKNLDFTKAQHWVTAFDYKLTENLHLKLEPYFQYLYHVPVIADSSFSIINYRFCVLDALLINNGKGLNYGLDLTLERYMNLGYYYMLTASVFNSRYTGGDGVWRNTRLNRNFLFNVLGGKEWMIRQKNILGVNIRLSFMGGERYSPIHPEASPETMKDRDPIYDESRAFSLQQNPVFVSNITLTYKMNHKKTAHEFAIKILNVNGFREFLGYTYNYRTQQMVEVKEAYIMPSISYKIDF